MDWTMYAVELGSLKTSQCPILSGLRRDGLPEGAIVEAPALRLLSGKNSRYAWRIGYCNHRWLRKSPQVARWPLMILTSPSMGWDLVPVGPPVCSSSVYKSAICLVHCPLEQCLANEQHLGAAK